eukprot:gene14006-10007_t
MVALNAPPPTAMPIGDPYAVQNYAATTASYPFASPTPIAFAMPQPGASLTTAPGAPTWNTGPTIVGAAGFGTNPTDYYAAASVPMAPLTTTAATGAPHSSASEPHARRESVSHHATEAATAPTVVPAPYVLPSTTYASSVAAFNPASYVPASTTTSAALGGGGLSAPAPSASSSVPTYSTYPYPTIPSLATVASGATGATAAPSGAAAATSSASYASYSPYTPYTPYTPGAAHP